jgi:hypothetical protein
MIFPVWMPSALGSTLHAARAKRNNFVYGFIGFSKIFKDFLWFCAVVLALNPLLGIIFTCTVKSKRQCSFNETETFF